MNRRTFITHGLSLSLVVAEPGAGGGQALLPLSDMHFHLYFAGEASVSAKPMRERMAEGGATLVAWALVADLLWIKMFPGGVKQVAEPRDGELSGFFMRELDRIKRHATSQEVKWVLGPGDISRAAEGEPHIVLATEGGDFIERDIGRLESAYEHGLRQTGLVHYTRNPVGDFQTERPEHGGLTELGRRMVQESDRLGILVDLAHCTDRTTNQALELSGAPMIWSHSSIVRTRRA